MFPPGICVSLVGEHISLVICVSQLGQCVYFFFCPFLLKESFKACNAQFQSFLFISELQPYCWITDLFISAFIRLMFNRCYNFFHAALKFFCFLIYLSMIFFFSEPCKYFLALYSIGFIDALMVQTLVWKCCSDNDDHYLLLFFRYHYMFIIAPLTYPLVMVTVRRPRT